jgi:hypothetical protein
LRSFEKFVEKGERSKEKGVRREGWGEAKTIGLR